MAPVDLGTLAGCRQGLTLFHRMDDVSFLEEYGDNLAIAGATLLVAFLIAFVVDRWFQRRARRLADAVSRGRLSREADTRIRFVRRLLYAAILLVGFALALTQFAGVNRIAASLLASGVVAAAIIGFAARQTLANFVAGVMLAITQPLRVGDWVTIEEYYGVVEDVRLNHTVMRTAGDHLVLIPNEKLAGSVLKNDTLAVDVVGLDVAIWLPPGCDARHAVELLRDESGADVSVAEALPTGIRLAVGGGPVPPDERPAREADLRARCLARLHDAGLLQGFGAENRT
jgi:small-conductance mechanosensitive channel